MMTWYEFLIDLVIQLTLTLFCAHSIKEAIIDFKREKFFYFGIDIVFSILFLLSDIKFVGIF